MCHTPGAGAGLHVVMPDSFQHDVTAFVVQAGVDVIAFKCIVVPMLGAACEP